MRENVNAGTKWLVNEELYDSTFAEQYISWEFFSGMKIKTAEVLKIQLY